MKRPSHHRPASPGRTLAIAGAIFGGLAAANHFMARRAERRHPPKGSFLEVDGVRLHYTDRGEGSPVILIHGVLVMGDDYDISGVVDLLLKNHQVIIFDRPGYGHSARPRSQIWTANKQADLLHKAFQQLGIIRPVVVGHSWGAIVALAMAVRHERDIAGVVALGGYYFPTFRPDALMIGLGALPVIGDVLRYTISPPMDWLLMPVIKRALFSPATVAPRFNAEFSTAMALRPSQIRATSEDSALMIQGAAALQAHYKDLTLPVAIVAGDGDKVVFKRRAERLQTILQRSVLHVVPGAGHMVHYKAAPLVVEAVAAVEALASPSSG